ncbi:hypothetical protein DI09_212p10 [Mitosporidium daphniae]|uniref:Uncharacterized protein n=1 Tax=Mitosporidium daphniae TaxID=1485682 RepID=A0A098VSL3_9MICR|nr:uncharacterized protein DI09_212p10 [Mitosporidium daphniae]KGG52078.1 hypothetical protein DI09_212p10 [Mitosporidium daphniae]|eukprot:XP_013238514.1 uncharacterized protein DI09_212p10 [Mitosporidium daphniae]
MLVTSADAICRPPSDGESQTIPKYADISSDTSIVIDNGSFHLRAGYSSQDSPCVDVGNYITKYNVKTDSKILYGLGASSASSSFVGHNMSRVGTRSAFENDVTLNFDVMETTLDGLFCTLGIAEYPIKHPIVLTEVPCNPSRKCICL